MPRRRKPERRQRGTGYITSLAHGRAKAHYPNPAGGYFVKRCDTTEEAEEWLAQLGKRDAGSYDLEGGQQLLKMWLPRWVDLEATDPEDPLKEKTTEDYRFKLGYVIDLLGDMVLAEIKYDHTDSALRLIRKNLAQNTADQIRNLFYRAMQEAVERDYIQRNPVKKPKRRKRRRRQDIKAHEKYRLSLPLAARLIQVSASRLEALSWWLMLVLGLREGEVLGLKREHIDLENATLNIIEQNTQLRGRAHKSTTKTDYSDRLLPFPRALVPAFEALYKTLNGRAERALKRGTWQGQGLIFPGKSGRAMNPSSLLHMLKRMAPAVGLPGFVNVHHLRHTAASIYTNLEAPDVIRAAIAGHSPKTITDFYGEPDIEALRPWVEKVYQQVSGEIEKLRMTGS